MLPQWPLLSFHEVRIYLKKVKSRTINRFLWFVPLCRGKTIAFLLEISPIATPLGSLSIQGSNEKVFFISVVRFLRVWQENGQAK